MRVSNLVSICIGNFCMQNWWPPWICISAQQRPINYYCRVVIILVLIHVNREQMLRVTVLWLLDDHARDFPHTSCTYGILLNEELEWPWPLHTLKNSIAVCTCTQNYTNGVFGCRDSSLGATLVSREFHCVKVHQKKSSQVSYDSERSMGTSGKSVCLCNVGESGLRAPRRQGWDFGSC